MALKAIKLSENPELIKELEEELKLIRVAMQKLLNGRVSRRAIVVLLKDMLPSNVRIGDIVSVLEALEKLDKTYLKEENK